MRRPSIGVAGALVVALLAVGSARAVDPADACKADKMRRAGLYDLCLLKARSKALKKGIAPNLGRCDAQFAAGWAKAEAKAAGACPTTGDAATLAARVNADVAGVIAALTPTTTTTSTSTTSTTLLQCGTDYPGCGGSCPSGMSCWANITGPPPVTSCACLPADVTPCAATGGPLSSGPHCGGACPTGQVCSTLYVDDTTLSLTCGCMPAGQLPCLSFTAQTCGGGCPAGMACGVDPLHLFPCRCQ